MSSFGLAKAIKNNTIYANTTKPPWRDRFYQVAKQLGLRHQTPTAAALADAIYNWQLKPPGMTADLSFPPDGQAAGREDLETGFLPRSLPSSDASGRWRCPSAARSPGSATATADGRAAAAPDR